VLVRHGRTAWNASRRFQGRTDIGLDAAGHEQVQLVAAEVARLGPSAVLTSDASRAHQSAEVLCELVGTTAVIDPRLREAEIGAWEGLTRDEVKLRFPDEYHAWRNGADVRRGGGETYGEVAARAAPAVMELLARLPSGGLLVVVTHGGTAKALLGHLLGLPSAHWGCVSTLSHGRWSVLEEVWPRWRLEQHNVRPRRPLAAGRT
jgi:glucosyl-3-phosphoglycerate phosphatase